MQQTTPIITEIVRKGQVIQMTWPGIAALLRDGLTIEDYEALALCADEHGMTILELIRRALEVDG